ncbi:MAG: hypothetical protein AUJ52_15065 [Elusimicrobia bacterium CG1_02_63_36]|nr:MAG: hypothetical protein AUJ52_15065 [Elusimicrobia bacterium CG1_02_63_36]PJA12379.1 MAG: hypothetical protein COX66_17485 [Elusimicrobia bacterium CG_4_10_14_0_2_um_filter_63_34]PJB26158.1 MAG: hypothetical protein CO113_04905 [Elusimicrobia bacterium CG_4_9_14_3_um_filter_62_55]
MLGAIRHVFAQRIEGVMLVGGTALAGYYAGHRRSDDMDLFTRDEACQRAAALAVRSLVSIGAEIDVRSDSAQFFRAGVRFRDRDFTVDAALHARLHEIGRSETLPDGVVVADFDTLLKMKTAALISRCGEKDLYDLLWILDRPGAGTLESLMAGGRELDAGMTPEGLIISVSGATLSAEACGFALDPALPAEEVYAKVEKFRIELLAGFQKLAAREPAPEIADLIKRVGRLS